MGREERELCWAPWERERRGPSRGTRGHGSRARLGEQGRSSGEPLGWLEQRSAARREMEQGGRARLRKKRSGWNICVRRLEENLGEAAGGYDRRGYFPFFISLKNFTDIFEFKF
jgi:hypothetical protein